MGVVHVEGEFAANEAVRLVVVDRATWRPPPSSSSTGTSDSGGAAASTGVEVGRALVNYSNGEIMRIKGHKTTDIKALLGYADSEHVAQREYISFFQRNSRPATPTLSQ